MPAFRSFFALTILAACLAQASAGGDGGSGGFGGAGQFGGGQDGGQGGGQGGSSWGGQGGGGQGGGQGGGSWGGQGQGWDQGGKNQYTASQWQAPPTTQVAAQTCPPQTCPAQNCPPPATETKTETTTVTAVSACSGSTVTAYVTQWQNAPPGCWCGPPPTGLPAGGAVAVASVSITPGLSSIPAAEAVKTGVLVAGPAGPPPAATATVSPGGFFGSSSEFRNRVRRE
ncbi:hypothetical protein A1O7_07385 [Cladophialophora yegresii CBS 114405]|uniref:Uncharacterized protein n=1 Tax=Cladophialophora yegresii CBS 114405 TaxID=1182544 RepID=W9VXT6_9EURO|nr:uncharacterized protein A1O7_07385 [Cladophialophora yegresii CBS 114405]EXJ57041.1 hypothetical protein A1O7_07385 [Cladophialophora yegresii CBS 114405]